MMIDASRTPYMANPLDLLRAIWAALDRYNALI